MDDEQFSLAMSSLTRLRILNLLSVRPRTLRELAGATKISVQGVLRHVTALEEAGMAKEKRLSASRLTSRKVYYLPDTRVMDLSVQGLAVVKVSRRRSQGLKGRASVRNLESVSEDLMMKRRRVREKVRRVANMIDDLAEEQDGLVESIEQMDLSDDEKLVLQTLFTEETTEDAEAALSKHHGVKDARALIDRILAKARRNEKK